MASKDFMKTVVVEDTRVYDELGNVISGHYGYTEKVAPKQGTPAPKTNTMAHNTTNNVPSSKDEYELNFIPNILDNYDQYTYHWKLFITSLENAHSGAVLNTNNQIIIAESGVSDLTIDKVELNGIAVPSVEAGTGTQTLVKFEIVEPSGAGLLDKMFYQATALGIGNWLVMPCFLQLEFRGREPDTSESVTSGSPSGLGGLKWVWPLKLTNSKAKVSQVGTRYEFDAIIYDELAQSNSYFAIQHNTVLKGLTTFGKAMQDLEQKLNADQYEKLIDNYSIPDSYKIIVDPELENIGIVQPNDNKSTAFGRDFIDFQKKTATFNAGTGIDKIVDAILGNTNEFQKLMQGSDTPAGQPKAANQVTDQMKKLWRVVTETRPIAFDMLRQDNAVEISIFIVKYDLGMADVNASQTGQTPDTRESAKKRMVEYIKKKILNKKYNYIFTGLNDQIISFDLNMNYSFAASLARFGGIYYDSAINMPGVAVQKQREENEKKATEEIRKILNFINSATPDQNVDAKINEARNALNSADIDPTLKSRYTTLLNNAKPSQRTAFVSTLQASGGISASGTTATTAELEAAKKRARSLSEPRPGTNSNGENINLRFISDVNINSPAAKAAYDIAISNRKGKLRPIPYREGQQENSLAYAMDPSSNSGRSRVANVFSTALYSTLDASLQSVKLVVKGDPYWLFPRNINPNVEVLPYKSKMNPADAINAIRGTQDTTAVNLFGSDNFIVIRFRTPRIYDQVIDSMDPYTEVETFSGVYKVITIVSKFEMGKFTQELTCILDPMINLSDFLKDIEESSGKSRTPLAAADTSIPSTAKKSDRLSTTNITKGKAS